VALYSELEGAPLRRALTDAPSAGEAVAAMLREGAIAYTDPGKPSGCMIVLAATTYTPKTEGIRDYLAEQRRAGTAELRERVERGRTDGELRPEVDASAVANYFSTVLHGMSVQARDGASRAELLAVAEAAMASWGALTGGRLGWAARSEPPASR
jgi:hypothetical protein